MEFALGVGDLFSDEDPDIRAWARENMATWAPVIRGIKGLDTEDPLDSPEGDPAWDRLKEVARGLGLEKEVKENPRGGPILAAAMRRKENVFCWASGTARSNERSEVSLSAFAPGLRFTLELGSIRAIVDGRIGQASGRMDVIPVVGKLIDEGGDVLAELQSLQCPLPGNLASECDVTGEGAESIHLWLRGSKGGLVRWWVKPVRLPQEFK